MNFSTRCESKLLYLLFPIVAYGYCNSVEPCSKGQFFLVNRVQKHAILGRKRFFYELWSEYRPFASESSLFSGTYWHGTILSLIQQLAERGQTFCLIQQITWYIHIRNELCLSVISFTKEFEIKKRRSRVKIVLLPS